MADTVNPEDQTREELNQLAKDAGLTDVEKYQNKPAVADAINRVRNGEDAAAVSAELAPAENSGNQTTTQTPDDKKAASAAPEQSGKKLHAVNGASPRKFDETGNPVYDPEQV